MSEAVAAKIEIGDHGGTYCGNPLGCAVARAVIQYLVDHNISGNVERMGGHALERMGEWRERFREAIVDVRGRGLLLLIEFKDEDTAMRVSEECLKRRLFVRQTQGRGIRIFPALNIREQELEEGLSIIQAAIEAVLKDE
jgi:acetylornithine/N-succinyldiaminopimelate aminotransferase